MDEVKLENLSGRAGVIKADEDSGCLDRISHQVLDDILYNVIFDLVLEVHCTEKTRRANTAALRVEKLAADAADASEPDSKPDVRAETNAAVYEDGKVMLKGNPLHTTKDILCPRCHLPRLLNPTDGRGAQKPDPGVIYCKKYPYIDKPGHDIYGQTWVAPGPGRGKKKKDMEKKLDASVDGTVTPNADGQRPPNVLSFPSATCSKCKRCILVTRLNNHMGACIGNSGRNASRVASQKITNGGSAAGDNTPPSSHKGTPLNGSRAGSPRKRDADELDEDQDSDPATVKKKTKKLKGPTTKILLKKVPRKDREKIKPNSFLSVESKVDNEEDDEDRNSTVLVVPKKPNAKQPSPAKKLKPGASKPCVGSPKEKNGGHGGHGGHVDGGYESSDTLSDPPHAS